MNRANYIQKQSGFTLVEIAVAIVIVGILLASFSQVAKMYFIEKKDQELRSSLNTIVAHLSEYVRDTSLPAGTNPDGTPRAAFVDPNVHYPCPAGPNIAPTDPAYGLENRNATTNVCEATNGVILAGNVYIGTVPFRTLGISGDSTVDPWGNKFTYAVSQDVTAINALRNNNPPGSVLIATASSPTVTIPSHFSLVSHGPSGAGAWSPQGARIACSATATVDQENCDDDATFLDGSLAYSTAQNTSFYDDKMIYTLEGLGDTDIEQFWRLNPADTTEIHNTNTGNVGIGVTDPQVRLDVAGELKVGNTSIVCAAGVEGATRYNNTRRIMEYCDGTNWKVLGFNPANMNIVPIEESLCSRADNAFLVTAQCPAGHMLISCGGGEGDPSEKFESWHLFSDYQNNRCVGRIVRPRCYDANSATKVIAYCSDGVAGTPTALSLPTGSVPNIQTLSCTPSIEGEQRYNEATNTAEFCNGVNWISMAGINPSPACFEVHSGLGINADNVTHAVECPVNHYQKGIKIDASNRLDGNMRITCCPLF